MGNNRLVFLGTGGGKHVMFSQVRKTGGIYVELDGLKLVIDPGPGSLLNLYQAKLKPETLNGILLSHHHLDHASDANVLIDGMKEPFLVAEEHCILPKEKLKEKELDYYPCITVHHQSLVKQLHPVKAGDKVKIKNLEVRAVKADHYAPCVGFVISGSRTVGYAADGTYFTGQEQQFEGCDVLILNVLVPKGEPVQPKKHMSVDEAITLLRRMKKQPKLVVIQHFSMWMLRAGLLRQAKIIRDATKLNVVAADDFMNVDLDTLAVKG